MRKYQQKQLLELIGTLHEANVKIKKFLDKENKEAAVKLILDSNECAIQIGHFIEENEGEGTATVSYLEQYCELLYQASISVDSSKTFKQIKKQLSTIENSIKLDLRADRFEAVFLPYKASMWDSMESVWLAAKDDPQCDAYVIPIPYYDIQPGKVLGKMHYEGDQYPDYVPITDWRQYKIEERHPDIIYVHNPYDDTNLVTSVHPDFYCKELKNYTDLLVYIPYFVCLDDVPEHFCVNPGTIYADRVMVESDKIRDTYIREFRKFEKQNQFEGMLGKPKEKFVALGSPKFDKVFTTKRDDSRTPEEWLKLIVKQDGSRKKVVLYNTSLSGLLEGNEKVLTKLRYVFNCFKGKEDVVLLWRPHPLSASTYAAMRPTLLNEYQKIVAEYRQDGWGIYNDNSSLGDILEVKSNNLIYDDSSDLHRAIALSDAYYGDWSSVVELYTATGKPIMWQNVDETRQNDEHGDYRILPWCFCVDEKYVWFILDQFGMLLQIDLSTYKVSEVDWIPNEDKFTGKMLYWAAKEYRGKIYFSPVSAKEIAVYDIDSKRFDKIAFRTPDTDISTYSEIYCGIFPYGDYVYFIPAHGRNIIRLNTQTNELDFYDDWYEKLNCIMPFPSSGSDLRLHNALVPCFAKDSIWLAAGYGANAVVEFNLKTHSTTVYKVSDNNYHYGMIRFDGENFWLCPWEFQGEPIVKWHPDKGVLKEFFDIHTGTEDKPTHLWPKFYGNYLHFIPWTSEHGYKINVRTDEISIDSSFEIADAPETSGKFLSAHLHGNLIYTFNHFTNKFAEINLITSERKEFSVTFSDTCIQIKDYLDRLRFGYQPEWISNDRNNIYYWEGKERSLTGFLNYLVSGYEYDSEVLNPIRRGMISQPAENAGRNIYNFCKQQILK
ncbi:hypothetical protein [Desulfosporosinus sp. FKA]|uniref:hypothetical protein n=1 Tax=Desulfosporosinus sp. FKA TaxID=1969834 RepID=UPI001A9A4966|nr:hypothetical protein [Desulfosporosinus sp. FKA]